MISKVRIEKLQSDNPTHTLDLLNPWANGILVKSIEGLDPAEAIIYESNSAGLPGSRIGGSRLNRRNIVFNLGFATPRANVHELRMLVYRMFPPGEKATLTFTNEYGDFTITGYVESVESNMFSESVEPKVSIICPSPYFLDSTGRTGLVWNLANNPDYFSIPAPAVGDTFTFVEGNNSAVVQTLPVYDGVVPWKRTYALRYKCLSAGVFPTVINTYNGVRLYGAGTGIAGRTYVISLLPGQRRVVDYSYGRLNWRMLSMKSEFGYDNGLYSSNSISGNHWALYGGNGWVVTLETNRVLVGL